MYGIVNKAIEEMLIQHFNVETWKSILEKSGIEDEGFISNQPYPDEVTYKLATVASETLDIPLPELLFSFGEFWILDTGKTKYGSIIDSGGADIKSFFVYLPNLHSRVSLIFPDLHPPEFEVSHVEENGLQLHYYSHRPALKDFVKGLISGIGKLFNKEVAITMISDRDKGDKNEIFQIYWN